MLLLHNGTYDKIGGYQKWDTNRQQHISTVDGKGGLSNNFSVIFPSFVHLLATKPMAKQSRASGQLSGGHWVEYRAEF